ncbi:hypothetical protein NYY89_20540, partial [Acinetobacter baumannii]|nr:hypothetical protein [Acinetobacter baumannii]
RRRLCPNPERAQRGVAWPWHRRLVGRALPEREAAVPSAKVGDGGWQDTYGSATESATTGPNAESAYSGRFLPGQRPRTQKCAGARASRQAH